jgi:hypothetical protein
MLNLERVVLYTTQEGTSGGRAVEKAGALIKPITYNGKNILK